MLTSLTPGLTHSWPTGDTSSRKHTAYLAHTQIFPDFRDNLLVSVIGEQLPKLPKSYRGPFLPGCTIFICSKAW